MGAIFKNAVGKICAIRKKINTYACKRALNNNLPVYVDDIGLSENFLQQDYDLGY